MLKSHFIYVEQILKTTTTQNLFPDAVS